VDAKLEHAEWRKSSRSSGGSNNCVEVAMSATTIGVRDTKHRAAGHLSVTPYAWSGFLAKVTDREC
jgi:hypothetical protein